MSSDLRFPISGLDQNLLGTGLRRITEKIVQRLNKHGRMCGRKDGVGEVASVGHMMHSQVKPNHTAPRQLLSIPLGSVSKALTYPLEQAIHC